MLPEHCACLGWVRPYGSGRAGEEHHRDCRHWNERVGDAYVTKSELIVIGDPTDKENHDCDAMGCATFSHVVFRMSLARATAGVAPDAAAEAEYLSWDARGEARAAWLRKRAYGGVTLTTDDAAFLAARLRRLFALYSYSLPDFARNDASLIRIAGSCIGAALSTASPGASCIPNVSTRPNGLHQESNDGRTDHDHQSAAAPGASAVGGAGAQGRDAPASRGCGDAGGNDRDGSDGTPVGGSEAKSLTSDYDCCTVHQLAHPCEACAAELPFREFLEHWMHDGRLQTFQDRERFRNAARELLGTHGVPVSGKGEQHE